MDKNNNNQGWIKLHRKILNLPICSNAEILGFYVGLLLKANHKAGSFFLGNQKIELKAGQFVTGRKQLSQEFGISESKVQRTLLLLESEHLIEQQMNSKYRIITIVSLDDESKNEQQNEQQMNNKRTSNEHQMNTNKNDKNDKNVENDDNINLQLIHETEVSSKTETSNLLDLDNPEMSVLVTGDSKETKRKVRKKPDKRIDDLILYLKQKAELKTLDGTVKQNRFRARNLFQKLEKMYDGQDALQLAKYLIDYALTDQYMAGQLTSISWLYYNVNKIIQVIKSKQQKNSIYVV